MGRNTVLQAVLFLFTVLALSSFVMITRTSTTITGKATDAPVHCTNGIMDTPFGEEGVDCNHAGGPCDAECPFYVRLDHPRLFVTSERLPTLRCYYGIPGNENNCANFGIMQSIYQKQVTYYSNNNFLLPLSFLCLMEGGVYCDRAKELAVVYTASHTPPRESGEGIGQFNTVALFFDWVYPYLSSSEKAYYGEFLINGSNVYMNEAISDGIYRSYWGHCYYPTYPLSVFGEGVNDTAAFNGVNASHYYFTQSHMTTLNELAPEGGMKGYGNTHCAMPYTAELFLTALNENYWDQFQFIHNEGKYFLYRTRNSGAISDSAGKYNPLNPDTLQASLFPARTRDPYLQRHANYIVQNWDAFFGTSSAPFNLLNILLFYDPTVPAADSFDDLPRSYIVRKEGELYMRDSFSYYGQGTANDIHAGFFNGPSFVSDDGAQNHFIISRGDDPLIIHGARYLDDSTYSYANWFPNTISYNGLLVYDPSQTQGQYVACGGQSYPLGKSGGASDPGDLSLGEQKYPVTNANQYTYKVGYRGEYSHYAETDTYIYARGADAALAYNDQPTPRLNEWTRDFVYILPDLFLVFDRVDATNPQWKKSITLHTVNKPTLDGTEQQIEGGVYGGVWESTNSNQFYADRGTSRIYAKTLLPKNTIHRRVGGGNAQNKSLVQNWNPLDPASYDISTSYEWYFDGKNNPPCPGLTDAMRIAWNTYAANPTGDWRIEVESENRENKDYFLQVLQPTATSATMVPATLVESNEGNLAGALINGTTTVLFAKQDNLTQATITIEATRQIDFIIFGLESNHLYGVAAIGQQVTLDSSGSGHTSSDQGILSFTLSLSGGECTLQPGTNNYYVDINSICGQCSDLWTKEQNAVDVPWCTMSTAIAYSAPGDTIYVQDGMYNEIGLSFTKSGNATHNISYVALGTGAYLGNFVNITDEDMILVPPYAHVYSPPYPVSGGMFGDYNRLMVLQTRFTPFVVYHWDNPTIFTMDPHDGPLILAHGNLADEAEWPMDQLDAWNGTWKNSSGFLYIHPYGDLEPNTSVTDFVLVNNTEFIVIKNTASYLVLDGFKTPYNSLRIDGSNISVHNFQGSILAYGNNNTLENIINANAFSRNNICGVNKPGSNCSSWPCSYDGTSCERFPWGFNGDGWAISVTGDNNTLRDSTFMHSWNGMMVSGEGNLVENVLVHGTPNHCGNLGSMKNTTLKNVYSFNCQDGLEYVQGGAQNVLVEHSYFQGGIIFEEEPRGKNFNITFRNNIFSGCYIFPGGNGIRSCEYEQTMVFENNLFLCDANDHDGQMRVTHCTDINLSRNTWYEFNDYITKCDSGELENCSVFRNNVFRISSTNNTDVIVGGTKPYGVDFWDYHLTSATSAAVDIGSPDSTTVYDFEGQIRPQGRGFDAGPDEWDEGGQTPPDTTPPTVALIMPADSTNTTTNNISLSCVATDDVNLSNITIWYASSNISWASHRTNTANGTSAATSFNVNLAENTYEWNCQARDQNNNFAFAQQNWTLVISELLDNQANQSCNLTWNCTPWSIGTCGERTCTCTCTDGTGCSGDHAAYLECPTPPDDNQNNRGGGGGGGGGGSPTYGKIDLLRILTAKKLCEDGLDNEGGTANGCIDQKDVLCGGIERYCTGRIDNDCDGLIDCADTDCAADESCINLDETQTGQTQDTFSLPDFINTIFTEQPQNQPPEPFETTADVQNYFGFLNWIFLGILSLLFIGLIFVQHIRPAISDSRVPSQNMDDLSIYIYRKLKEGKNPEEIIKTLQAVGWIDDVIQKKLAIAQEAKQPSRINKTNQPDT